MFYFGRFARFSGTLAEGRVNLQAAS